MTANVAILLVISISALSPYLIEDIKCCKRDYVNIMYIYIFNSTKAFFKAHDPRERKIYNKQTKKMCVNVAMNRVI